MSLFMIFWTSLLIEAAQNRPPNPYMRIDAATCNNEQASWINDAVWAAKEALRIAYDRTVELEAWMHQEVLMHSSSQHLGNEQAASTLHTFTSYITYQSVLNPGDPSEPIALVKYRINALAHRMEVHSGRCEILCNKKWLEPAPVGAYSHAVIDDRSSWLDVPMGHLREDRHILDIRQHIRAGDDESTATVYRHLPGQYRDAIVLSDWPWDFWTRGMESAPSSDGQVFESAPFYIMRREEYPSYIWQLRKLLMFQLMATILRVLQTTQPAYYLRGRPSLDGFLTDALEPEYYTAIVQRALQEPANTTFYADNVLYLIISLYLNNSDWSLGTNRPLSDATLLDPNDDLWPDLGLRNHSLQMLD